MADERAYTTDELDAMERGGYTTEQLDAMERQGAPRDARSTMTRLYQENVAKPLTGLVSRASSDPYGIAGRGGEVEALLGPTPLDVRAGEATGRMAVPQTPEEAAILLGTMGAGSLAAQAGMSPLKAALTRILGATAGGAVGGALGEAGAVRGAEQGAMGATAGEIVGAVGSKIARAIPGAKRRIANQDAAAVLEQLGEQSPGLKDAGTGATASQRLHSLATGEGVAALGARKEQQLVQTVEARLGGPGQLLVPSISDTPVTVREANRVLTEIGEGLRHMDILDPTLRAKKALAAYNVTKGQIVNELESAAPGAGGAFEILQAEYKKGLAPIQKILEKRGLWRPGSQGVEYSSDVAQKMLQDPKLIATLKRKLGDDFPAFVDALSRGAGIGRVDVLSPGSGEFGAAMRQWLRGKNTGTMSFPLAAIRSLLPNVGAEYVGRQPYALNPLVQSYLDTAIAERTPAPEALLPR